MSHNNLHHVVHAIAHKAKHEREEGHHQKSNALSLIGFGIILLPIPIIGIPMLICGIFKAFTAGDD